jgi:Aspartyl protease/PDZ domain
MIPVRFIAALSCLAFTHAYPQLQVAGDILKLMNNVMPESSGFYYEIPFEYPGEIILKAEVRGKTYDFLFDTGGYTMIDAALVQDNDLAILGRQLLNSTNGLVKETEIVEAGSITIGGLSFNNVAAYCIDLANSPKLDCMVDGGIIGSAIIQNYIWQIDYPNRKIIVTDDVEKLPGMEGAIKIPVYLNGHLQPYFMSRINGRSQWLMFDTGCASLLWIGDKDAQNFIDNAPARTEILGGSVETHHGKVSDTINVFKADCVINDLKFEGMPAFYREGSGLTLFGNPVIKDYIVTLNFAQGEMYFKPIKEKPSQGWDSFGFSLEYEEGSYKIATVIAGTSAQNLGLKPGDKVTAINGKKITCPDLCDCWEEFSQLLENADEITLTVLKKGKISQVKIKKEKIF